jgi:desulfoferrodoxin (superoxide reductase-like protein)
MVVQRHAMLQFCISLHTVASCLTMSDFQSRKHGPVVECVKEEVKHLKLIHGERIIQLMKHMSML